MNLSKRIISGAFIAASGAFVWALIVFTFTANFSFRVDLWQQGGWLFEVPTYAAYAVLVTSWFVLPIGGILGAAMPRIIRGCSSRTIFHRGILIGILTGIVAAILTMLVREWPALSGNAEIVNRDAWLRSVWRTFGFYIWTMSVLCSVWVVVWAFRWSKRTLA